MARTKFVNPLKKSMELARLPLSSHLSPPAGSGDAEGDLGLREGGEGLQDSGEGLQEGGQEGLPEVVIFDGVVENMQQVLEDHVREDQMLQVGEHILQQVEGPFHRGVGGHPQLAPLPVNHLDGDMGGLGDEVVVEVVNNLVGVANNKYVNFKAIFFYFLIEFSKGKKRKIPTAEELLERDRRKKAADRAGAKRFLHFGFNNFSTRYVGGGKKRRRKSLSLKAR